MFHTASIVGPANDRWGQTYAENGVYIVVEIEDEEHVLEHGHKLIPHIVEQFTNLPIVTLENVANIVAQAKAPESSTLILVTTLEGVLYVASKGNGSILVKRGENLATIHAGSGSLSGPIEDGDIFFVCSPTFVNIYPVSDIEKIDIPPLLSDLEDRLASRVLRVDNNSGAACLVLSSTHDKDHSAAGTNKEEETVQNKEQKRVGSLSSRFRKFQSVAPTRQKRTTLILGVILLAILSASLFFGNNHRRSTKIKQAYEQVSETAGQTIQEAEKLLGINDVAAQKLFSEAKGQIEQTLPYFPEDSIEHQELSRQIDSINDSQKKALHIQELGEPDLFFNVDWAKDGASATRISLFEDTLVMLDTDNNNIYEIDISQKNPEISATDTSLRSAKFIAIQGSSIYSFLDESPQRVVNAKGKTVIEAASQWGEIKDMKTYAGNIYLLDATGEIWKYSSTEDGFSDINKWFGDGLSLDFSDATTMNIDGSIWVLDENSIQQFTNTVPQSFYIKNEVLVSPKRMFTNEEVDYLYVLENNRVIVFDKDGVYHSQYLWDGFAEASDIVATADPHQALVLSGNKIYRIDIAQ